MRPTSAPDSVEAYDCAELVLEADPMADPFGQEPPVAEFGGKRGEGFCDDEEGRVWRVRLMPTEPGTLSWTVRFRGETLSGRLEATDGGRPGMVQADGWGFRWSATGEPFVWNGTTAYLLAGLREDLALQALDRLARLGVNRVRVSLCPSRQRDGGRWYEPQVAPREDFDYRYAPWPASRPESFDSPGFQTERFDLEHWRKYERIVRHARDLGVTVQVVFFTDAQEDQNYPFPREREGDDPLERRYYRYGVARLAALSNVEWCVTNEWRLFRPDEWVERIGPFIAEKDPYGHLLSVHGHEVFPFRDSSWCTHAIYQVWDEGGAYGWIRKARDEQAATGRIIPQVNDEYGYEDHYPGPWGGGQGYPARTAETRRRLQWLIAMAGGHGTTGESAADGAGGWINGLAQNDELLQGHAHLKAFLTEFGRNDGQPHEAGEGYALVTPDRVALYGPYGRATWDLSGWKAREFNPRTGEWADAESLDGTAERAWLLER